MSVKPSTFVTKTFFKNLSDALAGFMIWSWDDRYDTVVGKFKRQDAEQVIDVLERYFTAMWDPAIIETASEIEQEVNRQLGGIEPGQALYTTDPNVGDCLLCLVALERRQALLAAHRCIFIFTKRFCD